MAKKFTLNGCPCCGHPAFWIRGNRETRTADMVQCLECGLELEGDYEPMSAVFKWNFRTADHYIKSVVYNVEGGRCD